TLVFTSSNSTLSNVLVNGDLFLSASSARVILSGTTRFQAAHLSGAASVLSLPPGYTVNDTIQFEGSASGSRSVEMNGSSGTITIAAGGVIKTLSGFGGTGNIGSNTIFSGAMTLINNGTISSEASGRTLNVSATSFTNAATGTAQATGG